MNVREIIASQIRLFAFGLASILSISYLIHAYYSNEYMNALFIDSYMYTIPTIQWLWIFLLFDAILLMVDGNGGICIFTVYKNHKPYKVYNFTIIVWVLCVSLILTFPTIYKHLYDVLVDQWPNIVNIDKRKLQVIVKSIIALMLLVPVFLVRFHTVFVDYQMHPSGILDILITYFFYDNPNDNLYN